MNGSRKHWFSAPPKPTSDLPDIDDSKVIVWEQPNGLIAHTVVMGGVCPHAEAECIAQMAARDPQDVHHGWRKIAIIDRSQMPDGGKPDHPRAKWKAAWKFNGKRVDVSMPHAREIHRERMRTARRPKLESLDRDYMRSMESTSTKERKAIAARKQALRDVTALPEIEAAKTVEDLERVWPTVLTET